MASKCQHSDKRPRPVLYTSNPWVCVTWFSPTYKHHFLQTRNYSFSLSTNDPSFPSTQEGILYLLRTAGNETFSSIFKTSCQAFNINLIAIKTHTTQNKMHSKLQKDFTLFLKKSQPSLLQSVILHKIKQKNLQRLL